MLTPLPTTPSTFSAGTSQSVNTSSPVSEPRMPSLSSFCAVENPLKLVLDDKSADAARAGRGIRLGIHHDRFGHRTVGDPHFRTIEHIAVALPVGARAH